MWSLLTGMPIGVCGKHRETRENPLAVEGRSPAISITQCPSRHMVDRTFRRHGLHLEALGEAPAKNRGEGGSRTHGPLTVTRFRVVAERLLLGLKTQKIL